MAENVGGIEYTVDINTEQLIAAQRQIDKSVNAAAKSVDKLGDSFETMNGRFRDSAGKLREANGQFVKLKNGAEEASGGVEKFGFKATGVATAVSAAFAAISFGSFLTKLVEVQRQFDILNAGLITATGSVEAAGAAFEALQKFAATTPYSIDQAVTAFTRLKNLGLDPSIKSLTAYGNTASAMGKDLMQMVEAVADASTGEFERLKEFGIRASKQGDNVSLTFKGVTETVKFSSKNIQKYLLKLAETNFSGAMEERARTLDGALSNLGDSWDQLFLTISKSGIGENIADAARVGSSALDVLGRSIISADEDSKTIRKNDHLKRWAESTVNAMANIADAAQKVWQTVSVLGRNVAFVFDSIGTEIGARAAQAKALLSGDFEAASDMGKRLAAESAQRRAALDKADAETLNSRKSWGDRMREEWKKGVMPGDPNALGGGGKVGGGGGGGGSSGANKPKFDSAGYINDLVIANADGLAKIDAQEKAKQAENDKLLAEGKISYQKYQQAQVLIAAAAEKDRADLRAKEKADTDQWLKDMYAIGEQASKDAAARAAQSRQAGEDIQRLGMTPEQQAQFDVVTQARDQLEELDALRQENIITQEQYAQAEIDINRRKVEEIRALEMDSQHARLQAASSFFGEAASLLENYGDNSSNTYKNLFRISKAFALADSLVSLQAAIMKASVSAPFPANLATMAAMGSAGLAVISNLRGVTFGGGRQYGGAVSADSLYRVNETGAPEMFTASNGRQYMMPNTKGEVTAANKLGGGGGNVIIHNYAGADVSATQNQNGDTEVIINRAVAEVASQIASNNGQVWSALKGATSIQSKL